MLCCAPAVVVVVVCIVLRGPYRPPRGAAAPWLDRGFIDGVEEIKVLVCAIGGERGVHMRQRPVERQQEARGHHCTVDGWMEGLHKRELGAISVIWIMDGGKCVVFATHLTITVKVLFFFRKQVHAVTFPVMDS